MKLPINYNEVHYSKRRLIREEYVRIQKGLCHHCGEPLDGEASEDIMSKRIQNFLFPKGFFKNPIHLHHNHDTGMTIGAVHSHCNAVLWQYHGE